MAYFVFLVGWFLGGMLIGLFIGKVMKQARPKEVQQYQPPLKELLIKAQREVDARHGIRRQ